MAVNGNIKKVKLSDGKIYSIFDEGALRLDPTTKKILTGSTVVDEAILDGHLSIVEIDDVPLANVQMKVLVQGANGEIKQQDIRQVLKNLGLITASVTDGTLNLEVFDFNGSV
ncbi:MAG: hypothetical protein J6T10_04565 [Methanobrevibacter sp.]|nr:hypothetical protein [Methanobrevibacter sp.]